MSGSQITGQDGSFNSRRFSEESYSNQEPQDGSSSSEFHVDPGFFIALAIGFFLACRLVFPRNPKTVMTRTPERYLSDWAALKLMLKWDKIQPHRARPTGEAWVEYKRVCHRSFEDGKYYSYQEVKTLSDKAINNL